MEFYGIFLIMGTAGFVIINRRGPLLVSGLSF